MRDCLSFDYPLIKAPAPDRSPAERANTNETVKKCPSFPGVFQAILDLLQKMAAGADGNYYGLSR